jgi:hypothetical protein
MRYVPIPRIIMNFEYSEKVQTLRQNTNAFMEEFVYPNEARRAAEIRANLERGRPYADYPLLDELKEAARARLRESLSSQLRSRRRPDESRIRPAR